jgi:alkylated DNA nucleotide flippase Atl1
MRRRGLFLAALLLAVLAAAPSLATPPPWANGHPKPKPTTTLAATTTTLPATTTTTAPTTTTVAPTTTEPMPTTTVTMQGCQAPITISSGGVYSLGCVESTSTGTPAITISTTQPVTIERMLIKHKGVGVYAQTTTGTNVTIINSTLLATNPGGQVDQHACYLRQPASFTFEHNRLIDGHGILLAGEDIATNPLRIRYNDFLDIVRYPKASVTSAIQFDKVSAPNGALVSWNRVVNHHGRSSTEDVINMYQSNGAAGQLIEIDHNLIDGSYPITGDGAGFTGGGIDLGDSSGSYQVSHDNTVVRVTNNGLMIPAGSNLEHYANRVVNSGIADDGARVSSTFGNGMMVWDNPSYPGTPTVASEHDNTGDHRRWNGSAWERAWQWTPACDPAGACINNTNAGLSLTDDAAWLAEINDAIADWDTARVAAGVTVGPLP